MATRGRASLKDYRCVFVETNISTRLVVHCHKDENLSNFREKLCLEHKTCFPEIGEITVSVLKVKRRNKLFHLSNSLNLSHVFEHIDKDWHLYVDVEKDMLDDDSNREFLEKKEDIATEAEHIVDLTMKEIPNTEVQIVRKRKIESPDKQESRKKRTVDINQSAALTVDNSGVDNSGTIEIKDIAMGQNEKTPNAENLCLDNMDTNIDGHDVHTVLEADIVLSQPQNHLETSIGLTTDPPVPEEKKKQKMLLNDQIISTSVPATVEKEKVSERTDISESVPQTTVEKLSENEMSLNNQQVASDVQALIRDIPSSSGFRDVPIIDVTKKQIRNQRLLNTTTVGSLSTVAARKEFHNEIHGICPSLPRYTESGGNKDIGMSQNKKTSSAESSDQINSEPLSLVSIQTVTETALVLIKSNMEADPENVMGEKVDEDVGSRKDIPNQMEARSKGVSTLKKKRKQKKLEKANISSSTVPAKLSIDEKEKPSESINRVDDISESVPQTIAEKLSENEKGDKVVDNVDSQNVVLETLQERNETEEKKVGKRRKKSSKKSKKKSTVNEEEASPINKNLE